jgi:hypothetical protein
MNKRKKSFYGLAIVYFQIVSTLWLSVYPSLATAQYVVSDNGNTIVATSVDSIAQTNTITSQANNAYANLSALTPSSIVQATSVASPATSVSSTTTTGSYEMVGGKLVLPDNSAKMKETLNKGQWVGAQRVKSTKLAEIEGGDEPDGFDAATGEYDAADTSQYTDTTEKHLKNKVYMQQMFSGYNEADVENYTNSLSGYVDDPSKINDDVVVLKDDFDNVAEGEFTDCKDYTGEDFRKCTMYQATQLISGGENNEGKSRFGGETDQIILSSASLIDSTHPLYAQLMSGDCKEITKKEDDGEAKGLTGKRICLKQSVPAQACEATRFVETELVETKSLLSYTPATKTRIISNSRESKIKVKACDVGGVQLGSEEGEFVGAGCLEVTIEDLGKLFFSENNEGLPVAQCAIESYNLVLGISDQLVIGDATIVHMEYNDDIYFKVNHERALSGIWEQWINRPQNYADGNWQARRIVPHPCNGLYDEGPANFDFTPVAEKLETGNQLHLSLYHAFGEHFNKTSDSVLVNPGVKFTFQIELIDLPTPIDDVVGEGTDIIKGKFLGDSADFPEEKIINLLGIPQKVVFDRFDEDSYPVDKYLPANLRVVPNTVSNYLSYTKKAPTCSKQYFYGEIGTSAVVGELLGNPQDGYACKYEHSCTTEEIKSPWVETSTGMCEVVKAIAVECPVGYTQSSVYENKCVITGGEPEQCSTLTTEVSGCGNESYGGDVVNANRYSDLCLYKHQKTSSDCETGWEESHLDASVCVKQTYLTDRCASGSYPSEVTPGSCYKPDETFCASGEVLSTANIESTVLSYGRPSNKWEWSIELTTDKLIGFDVLGDIHQINHDSFKPLDNTDTCQPIIDAYISRSFPAQSECIDELGSQTATGINYNNSSTVGLLNTLSKWGTLSDEPLLKTCWSAKLIIDPQDGMALGGSALRCSGLVGSELQNCIEGKYCVYDDLNGQEVCYDLDGGRENADVACQALEDDVNCTLLAEEGKCEEYGEDADGNNVCAYESVVYQCEDANPGYSLPGSQSSEIICGGPVDCMDGNCSNIKEEENDAFGTAAVMSHLSDEIRKNTECASDPSTCTIFNGTSSGCSQPKLWGAQDCCNPDEMGMSGMNIIAAMKAADYLYDAVSDERTLEFMAESWSGVLEFVAEDLGATEISNFANAGTEFISSTITSASGAANSAMSTITNSISTGFTNIAKDMGFEFANDIAVEGGSNVAAALNASTATGTGAVAANGAAFTGMTQYVMQGVYNFISMFNPALANTLFATSVGAGGAAAGETAASDTVVTGFANSGATEMFISTVSVIGWIYTAYNVYNLVIGLVYGCNEEDFVTAQKIKLLSNHYSHSYCSSKTIFGCISYKQVHCVYDGPFARIMAEQLLIQKAEKEGLPVDEYWKLDKETARCEGYTIAEIEEVDWDRVDMTEFFDIMMAGYMQYDPSNIPEDFVPSEKGAGDRTGPDAGLSSIEMNINSINAIALDADQARATLSETTTVLSDAELMPWYVPAISTPSPQCNFSCELGWSFDSSTEMCVNNEYTVVTGTKSCNTFEFIYNAVNDQCERIETQPVTAGCPEGYTLDVMNPADPSDDICSIVATIAETAVMECPDNYTLRDGTTICEKLETVTTLPDCSHHGSQYSLVNTCYNGAVYNAVSDKCEGTGINESPQRQCVLSGSTNVPAKLTCPVTETQIPVSGVCTNTTFSYNAITDLCEKSDYTLDATGTCTLQAVKGYEKSCPAGEVIDLEENECVLTSTQTHEATISCDTGFTLIDGACSMVETSTPVIRCDTDNGFVFVNGRCEKETVHEVEVGKFCNEPYRPSADYSTCEKTVLVASIPPTCETGYTLEAGLCEKTIDETVPQEYVCRIGFSYNGTECVKKLSYTPVKQCDSANGFYYNESTALCQKVDIEIIPANGVCELPKVLGGGGQVNMCYEVVESEASYTCSGGYAYDVATDSCKIEKTVVTDALASCPVNHVYAGGECVQTIYTSPIAECPVGSLFDEDAGACLADTLVEQPLIEVCPTGHALVNGQCHNQIVEPAATSCLDPEYIYSVVDEKCVKTTIETIPASYLCPTGSTGELDGSCISTTTFDALVLCDIGFVFDSDLQVCVKETVDLLPGIPNCDVDYVFDATLALCVFEDSYVGSACGENSVWDEVLKMCIQEQVREPNVYCPAGYAFDGLVCSKMQSKNVSCSAGFVFDITTKQCEKDEVIAATVACPFGYESIGGGECKNILVQGVICPENSTYSTVSKKCEATPVLPAKAVCAPGFGDNDGNCSRLDVSPVTCEAGKSLDSISNTCKANDSVAVTTNCLKGTDIGNGCHVVETKIPDCPVNYNFNKDSLVCEKQTIVEGDIYCANADFFAIELTVENRCAIYEVRELTEEGSCPEAYFPHEQECRKFLLFENPLYNCPDGFVQFSNDPIITASAESSQCILLEENAPTCEGSYTFIDGLCKKTHFSSYDLSCPDGMTVEGQLCTSYDTGAITCPENYSYSSSNSRCEHISENAYTYICESGYTLSGQTCTSSAQTVPLCNANYTFDANSNVCVADSQEPKCSEGYTYDPDIDQCFKAFVIDATGVCPVGSNDDGTQCRIYETVYCGFAFTLDTDRDLCVKLETKPTYVKCPVGTEDTGTQCLPFKGATCTSNFVLNNNTNACERTLTEAPVNVCPIGMSDTGSGCLKQETPTCNSGYSYVVANDRCEIINTIDTGNECPIGTSDTGTGCLRQVIPACNSGYSFVIANDRCEKTLTEVPVNVCPVGTTDTGTGCLKQLSALCDAGYTFNVANDRCEKTDIMGIGTECPVGTTDTGSGCLKQETPICEVGYAYNVGNDRCERLLTQAPIGICPVGTIDTGSACLQSSAPLCNSGYTYVAANDRCEEILTEAPVNVCPAGTTDTGSGCLKQTSALCDAEYTFNASNDRCEKTDIMGIGNECPVGTTDTGSGCLKQQTPTCQLGYAFNVGNDRCERLLTEAPIGICPVGTTDTGSGCLQVDAAACNAGYTFNAVNDRCEKTETINIGEECPSGTTDTGSGCLKQVTPTCFTGYTYIASNDRCEKTETRGTDNECPSGTTDSGSGCIKQLVASCNSGFTFNAANDRCEKTTTSAATPSCSTGTNTGTGCLSAQYKPYSCPAGYTFDSSTDQCKKVETTPIEETCLPGYYDGGNGCAVTRAPTCLDGFVLNDDSVYMPLSTDGMCVNTQRNRFCLDEVGQCAKEALPRCPYQYEYKINAYTCAFTFVEEYQFTCPSGYTKGGGICTKVSVASPICDSGYTFDGAINQCKINVTNGYDVFTCPSGTTLSGTTCTLIETHSPNCDAGYTYNTSSNTCQTTLVYNYTCQSGWTLNSSVPNCWRVLTQVPNCPTGFSYNASSNKCEQTIIYTPTCPAGWTYSSSLSICWKFFTHVPNCEPGFGYNTSSNQCESTLIYTPTCQSGFTYNASVPNCWKLLTNAPSCESGFAYNSSSNKCEQTIIYTTTCESGWTLDSSVPNCWKLLTKAPNCDPSSTYNTGSNQCEALIPYTPTCQVGWTYDSAVPQCWKLVVHAPICDAGFAYNASSNQCELTIVYTPTCQSGWTYDGSVPNCWKLLTNAPSCESGFAYNSTSNKCEQTIIYTSTCESGWTLDSSVPNCWKLLTKAPNCDPSFTYNTGSNQCETLIDYTPTCQVGWAYDSAVPQCYKVLVHAPNCDTGFAYNTTSNQCEKAIAYTLTCPDGWTYDGSVPNCWMLVTQAPNCDTGFTYNTTSNQCERSYPYTPTCQDGWTYDGSVPQCWILLSEVPNCEAGYTYNTISDRCEAPLTPYQAPCDAGWSLVSGVCELETTILPPCSVGFTYNTSLNSCESDTLYDYNYSCPLASPSWTLVNDKCERSFFELASCDAGYLLVDDSCRNYVELLEINICPDTSYTLAGANCERTLSEAANCDGYLLAPQNNRCGLPVNEPSGEQCGDGWVLDAGQCLGSIINDRALECIDGYDYDFLLGECYRKDFEFPVFSCPPTFTLLPDERTCELKENETSAPIGYDCPFAGFELQGDQCVASAATENIYYCENPAYTLENIGLPGGEDNYVCTVPETVYTAVQYDCPSGWDLYSVKYCVKDEISVPTYICPDLFTVNTTTGMCEGTIAMNVAPILSCPVDFELTGSQCQQINKVDATFACSDVTDTLANGLCYSVEYEYVPTTKICINENSSGMCEQAVYTYPEYSCPTDYILTTFSGECKKQTVIDDGSPTITCIEDYALELGQCVNTTTEPAVLACPDHTWVEEGDLCTRSIIDRVNPDFCPTGAIVKFGLCYTIETDSFIEGCADGYTLNSLSSMCEKAIIEYEVVSYICPTDFSIVDTVCIKRTEGVTTISCNSVSDRRIGSLCYADSTTTGTPILSCASGYTDTGTACVSNVSFPADLSCADSTYLYDPLTGLCTLSVVEILVPTLICPTGYSPLDRKLCSKVIATQEMSYVCEDSTWVLRGDRCTKSVTDDTNLGFCLAGWQPDGAGACVRKFIEPYVLTCALPSELEGGGCVIRSAVTAIPTSVCN